MATLNFGSVKRLVKMSAEKGVPKGVSNDALIKDGWTLSDGWWSKLMPVNLFYTKQDDGKPPFVELNTTDLPAAKQLVTDTINAMDAATLSGFLYEANNGLYLLANAAFKPKGVTSYEAKLAVFMRSNMTPEGAVNDTAKQYFAFMMGGQITAAKEYVEAWFKANKE